MAKIAEDTPLLKHFFSIKAQYPEAILLYRVGDFYETYSDDAVLASKLLGLVLTKKSNGNKGYAEMAGFPHHSLDSYLPKLVKAGYKVAICDQLEDPAITKTKLVKRGITEILTPGIALGEGMLDQKEHNYLAGLSFDSNICGAAFLDVSTGTFYVAQGSIEYISTLLSSLRPTELVVEKDLAKLCRERFSQYYVSTLDEWAFVLESAEEKLCAQFGVESLKGYGIDKYPLAICSAGALMAYLEQTHHIGLKNICSISRIDEDKFVWMDRFTIDNLELFRSSNGGVTLVETLDKCCSPMGSRLLRQWLSLPLIDIKAMESRHDVVQALLEDSELREKLREQLNALGDMERIVARLATGRIVPREMAQLGRSLSHIDPIRRLCGQSRQAALQKAVKGLHNTAQMLSKIDATLCPTVASQIGKGDVIRSGVDAELDELRVVSRGGRNYLLEMQNREVERTGISSLKIGYNNVFGYYIEVRNTFKEKVPTEWIRKQTLVSAERYITAELKEYEEKILGADSKIYEIETRLYSELVAFMQQYIKEIQDNCGIVASIDVLQGFAHQADARGYCRPTMNNSTTLSIKDGRHPVIETLMAPGEEYVPNDIRLDSAKEQIIILTGPNMSGKSALLRQTALIVLMAQIGSFVPAREAEIGYFDKIFTRVGASDNISKGESTFMVEMLETSMIMHNLSARSLVLLDEIGRGTSTYDGMSIARALVEYVYKFGKGAKTLFATHYHELNDLESLYPRVKNFHIAIKEDGKNIIFLRKLEPGGVAHSFGIHVARLAGMPREVIDSAEKTLRDLERREKHASNLDIEEDGSLQLSFFQLDDPTLSSLRTKLERADLNNMTPMQAFDLLREMKAELGL